MKLFDFFAHKARYGCVRTRVDTHTELRLDARAVGGGVVVVEGGRRSEVSARDIRVKPPLSTILIKIYYVLFPFG